MKPLVLTRSSLLMGSMLRPGYNWSHLKNILLTRVSEYAGMGN